MVVIYLINGGTATVDDCDADLALLKWSKLKKGHIRTYIKGKRPLLHVIIADRMGMVREQVDHEDRNPSNCCRSNLRAATHGQNQMNSGVRKDSTSGVTGVNFATNCQKWRAFICIDGKKRNLGVFATKEQAALRRKDAEQFYYGKFAPKGV